SYGLRLRLEGSIVGGFVLGRGPHAKGGMQPAVVVPVDPGHGRVLGVGQGLEWPVVEGPGRTHSVLYNPMIDSISALSSASPTEPTEGVMPSSCRCSVNRMARYWADSTGRRNTRSTGVWMGRPPGWTTAVTGRPPMRSPGRPPVRREIERLFWTRIAEGLSSEDAALACGVSAPVGSRWFRHG